MMPFSKGLGTHEQSQKCKLQEFLKSTFANHITLCVMYAQLLGSFSKVISDYLKCINWLQTLKISMEIQRCEKPQRNPWTWACSIPNGCFRCFLLLKGVKMPGHILCSSSSARSIGTTNETHLAFADIWKTNASGHAKCTQAAWGLRLDDKKCGHWWDWFHDVHPMMKMSLSPGLLSDKEWVQALAFKQMPFLQAKLLRRWKMHSKIYHIAVFLGYDWASRWVINESSRSFGD